MGFPNAEQISIIEALEGALLVLAPAGTGKTRVMAERLSGAIENGYEPRRILGLTFTNRVSLLNRCNDRGTLTVLHKCINLLAL